LAKWVEIGDDPQDIHQRLVEQIPGCVLWHDSMKLISDTIEREKSSLAIDENGENLYRKTVCIEVGPGKVLSQLMKKNFPHIPVFSLEECLSDEGLQLDLLEDFMKESAQYLQ